MDLDKIILAIVKAAGGYIEIDMSTLAEGEYVWVDQLDENMLALTLKNGSVVEHGSWD